MSNATSQIIVSCLLSSFFLVMLVCFILTFLLVYQKKQLQFAAEMSELTLTHQNSLLCAQLEMQEKTLEGISREIHDSICFSLTLSKLQLNTLSPADPLRAQAIIQSSADLIGTALENLRNLSRSLNGDFFLQNGFQKSVERELNIVKQSGKFEVIFRIEGEVKFLDSSKELILFRVFQEIVQNTLKHSKASRITVKILYKDGSLDFSISDNGIGFDKIAVQSRQFGLSNIEKRVASLNGAYLVQSKLGAGTSSYISIPINNEP